MTTINREELLKTLNCVSPGLSTRDIIEQSSCYLFKNKEIITFNDEVACRMPCDIFGEQEAAVPAKIGEMISKFPDEMVDINLTDSEVIVKGKGRKVGVRIEKEVLSPIKDIETPKEWKKLSDDFCEAIQTVHLCASRKETVIALTCVHITPDMMQARDECQACRWKLQTGFSSNCLVRQNAIKHIGHLGMTHFSESDSWLHFKNGTGLVFSCRQWKESEGYPSLKLIFSTKDQDGKPIPFHKGVLSKSISEACERAEMFTIDNSDKDVNRVLIDLKPGRLRLRGEGVTGWYEEKKKLKYDGDPMSFYINPRLLSTIVKKHTDVELAKDRMRINGGSYVYVTQLFQDQPEAVNGSNDAAQDD